MDIYNETKRTINVPYYKECDACNGKGAANEKDALKTCPTCNGNGMVTNSTNTPFGMMQTQSVCPACNGIGEIIVKKCPKCDGKTYISDIKTVSFNVPSNIENNQTLIMRHEGNVFDKRVGDLEITFNIINSKYFYRQNGLLHEILLIDPLLAIVGGEVDLLTPQGSRKITISPSTKDGTKINLPNLGLIKQNKKLFKKADTRDDLVVEIIYAKPTKYSNEDMDTLKKIYARNMNNDDLSRYNYDLNKEMNR